MSKPKFTPKPWNLTVENTGDGNIHIDICDNSGHFIGLVVNNSNIGVEEALANANLMHAAPDMYEELEEILSDLDTFPQVAPGVDHPEVFDLKQKIQKLLCKARGESEVES